MRQKCAKCATLALPRHPWQRWEKMCQKRVKWAIAPTRNRLLTGRLAPAGGAAGTGNDHCLGSSIWPRTTRFVRPTLICTMTALASVAVASGLRLTLHPCESGRLAFVGEWRTASYSPAGSLATSKSGASMSLWNSARISAWCLEKYRTTRALLSRLRRYPVASTRCSTFSPCVSSIIL